MNVLLEAGACGVYALVNNCLGGINEIILPKINGEIFEIIQHENFAEKIKFTLKKDMNKEMIIDSIKNRFSKEIILKKYENVLK